MGGGLLQLITIGAQDVYITGDPQITFFKLVYRRHTNFAIESREQISNNNITSGIRTDIDIKREGDLINHMYLRIENPSAADTNFKKTKAKTFISNIINQNIYVENASDLKVNMDVMITAGVYNTSSTPNTVPYSMFRTSIIAIDYSNNILTITGKYPIIKNSTKLITTNGEFDTDYEYNMGFILPSVAGTTIAAGTKAPFQIVEVNGYGSGVKGTDDASFYEGTDIYSGASGIRGTANDIYVTAARISASGIPASGGSGSADLELRNINISGIYTAGNVGVSGIPYDMIVPTGSAKTNSWSLTDGSSSSCCSTNLNAYNLIDHIDLLIGGNTIDTMTGDLMDIWNELTITNGNKKEFDLMTSIEDSKYSYLPLYFWFNKTPGLALPLIALQYHTVTVRIFWKNNLPIKDQNCHLFIDYVFLDSSERRRFAQSPHEYLVETWQHHEQPNLGTTEQVSLIFNHPVKEMVWRAQLNNDTYVSWDSITLKFNNSERLTARHGDYFQRVQPFYHHNAIPTKDKGIHCYSFAIKPEEHQPSGSCNFSRLDNVTLSLSTCIKSDGLTAISLTQFDGSTADNLNLHVYVVCYNILRIMSGMGALAFAN